MLHVLLTLQNNKGMVSLITQPYMIQRIVKIEYKIYKRNIHIERQAETDRKTKMGRGVGEGRDMLKYKK